MPVIGLTQRRQALVRVLRDVKEKVLGGPDNSLSGSRSDKRFSHGGAPEKMVVWERKPYWPDLWCLRHPDNKLSGLAGHPRIVFFIPGLFRPTSGG
jgi:hypothetical protein